MVLLSLAEHLLDFRNEGLRLLLRQRGLQGHLAPRDVAVQHVGGLGDAGDDQQLVAGQAGVGFELSAGVVVAKNAFKDKTKITALFYN